jgi:hypothetical protein
MKRNELKENWKKCILECAESLNEGNFEKIYSLLNESIDIIKNIEKYDNFFEEGISNFGVINHLVEQNIVELNKNQKEFLKDYTKLIKEDKTLNLQYCFYKSLLNYNNTFISPASEYLTEAKEILVKENISKKSIAEANEKLFDLFRKHEIVLDKTIDENTMNYFNECENFLTFKKNALNLNENKKIIKTISEYLENRKNNDLQESLNKLSEITNQMSEDDMNILMTIKQGDEASQQKLFNEMKVSLENLISETISKTGKNERLSAINDKISEMTYEKQTFNENISKLLEIYTILS